MNITPFMGNSYKSTNDAYYDIYETVDLLGTRYPHREGRWCKEIRPYHFSLYSPVNGLYTGSTRHMNYRFWVAETLAYIAGWGSMVEQERYAQLLIKLNSNYKNFSTIHGGVQKLHKMVCYGDGFGPGLQRACQTLMSGPMRRQAIVYIGGPDTMHTYEDNPCLATAHFYIEKGLNDKSFLSALFHIRSNDLNWGFPYDVASFCAIQIAMAGALGIHPGRYHHIATSMHYYENGPMGEGPPKVMEPHIEPWIINAPEMPCIPNVLMTEIQDEAHIILCAMHQHFVVDDLPSWQFNPDIYLSHWGQDWCEIVRWRWDKVQT